MTRYRFSQDRKHTIWTRTHFTIDAPTQAEAIAKAATLVGQDVEDAEAEDEQINIEESETLYDSLEDILVEENNGNSTIDILFDNGDDLADNVTGAVWDYWWKESDDEVLESITGLRRSDFDPEDGGRTFAAACEEWWNKHSELEKIEIWMQQTVAAQRYCPHCGRRSPSPMSGTMPFNASTAMRIFTAPKSSPHPRHDRRDQLNNNFYTMKYKGYLIIPADNTNIDHVKDVCCMVCRNGIEAGRFTVTQNEPGEYDSLEKAVRADVQRDYPD